MFTFIIGWYRRLQGLINLQALQAVPRGLAPLGALRSWEKKGEAEEGEEEGKEVEEKEEERKEEEEEKKGKKNRVQEGKGKEEQKK